MSAANPLPTPKLPALSAGKYAWYGWLGIALLLVSWLLNWTLPGPRTFFLFFPLWLGYCLALDALNLRRGGTSLLTRSRRAFIGLFLVSAPSWWLFELLNSRVQNWHYLGAGLLTPWQYFIAASINFSIVTPAVFESAELLAGTGWLRRLGPWIQVRPDARTTRGFFAAGVLMLALLLAWPRYCFPFLWISIYCILEPVNIWAGGRSLAEFTARRDWRPVLSLFFGALLTGFFWELWNFYSFPKWVYTVPFVNVLHIFEMPLLGYGGYLPFSLEVFALYHLAAGLLAKAFPRLTPTRDYVRVS